MDKELKILFVEDDHRDAELIWNELKKNKFFFSKMVVDNRPDYLDCLEKYTPDVIISDYSLPAFDGISALKLRNEFAPLIPFILVTGSTNEEVAVECMKAGADDYILKGNMARLGSSVINSIKKASLLKEKVIAEKALKEANASLESIFRVAPAVIGIVRERIFMDVNEYVCQMTGYSRNELIGSNSRMLYSAQEDYDYVGNEKYRQIEEGGKGTVETRWQKKDGQIINIILSSTYLNNSDVSGGVIFAALDITDRKRAEEELRQSEMRFKQISEHSGEWIWEVDKNGLYTYSSPIVKQILGYEPEEIISKKHFYDFFAPEEREAYKEAALDFFARKQSFDNFINSNTHKDGRVVILSTSGIPVLDSRGDLIYYRGVDTNITERKRTEEAVDQERRMLRTLIDNLPDPIYVLDMNCRKVIANKADVRNIGYLLESEVLGKTDIELFPGQVGVRGHADNKEIIRSGKAIVEREEDFVDKNGVQRWLLTTKIPLHNREGAITGLVGIGYDITRRKLAEMELKQSYQFSDFLLKTIPFGMDIVDEEGIVLFQSDNFKRLFGEEAIGKKCWELYRDDKRQCKDCPLMRGIVIGETETYESYGILGNRIFEISHTGMMYQGKKAILEIFQDITDRKKNEEELIEAKEKAVESDRLKTAFLHNISHEIRTPMNAIMGFSTLLSDTEVDDTTKKSYIDVINQSSNHLLSIITDIVDISNIEANLVKIAKDEFNLNSVMKTIYDQLIQKVHAKKIDLIYENGLVDSEANIISDRTKITQILLNLVNNAIKFTSQGQVKFSYIYRDKSIEFCVSDSGIGIPEGEQDKIFGRFYQVQNATSRIYEGTGLGLAISKGYSELLGGSIRVESEPGWGSKFYLNLPIEKVAKKTKTGVPGTTLQSVSASVKKRILIAEDSDSNFKLINYFLSDLNADIIRAKNGKEAVAIVQSGKPFDVILMDIKMPEMDGYTASRLIKESHPSVPIVAQTAYADDREKAIDSGCSGFISKPFDKNGLLKILSGYII